MKTDRIDDILKRYFQPDATLPASVIKRLSIYGATTGPH